MQIYVESRRKKLETIEKHYPGATVIDVTSKGHQEWQQFSPFYPHGQIPIPNFPSEVGQSVEGIWQGLKVFEKEGVDPTNWAITSMKRIKRSGTRRGKVLGHRFGPAGSELLGYLDGCAWQFQKYSTDEELAKPKIKPREAQAELWAEANALAPWEFRQRQ